MNLKKLPQEEKPRERLLKYGKNNVSNNELIEIIVKLNIIYNGYDELEFKEIKKQIFEIKNKINYLLKSLDKR